MRGAENIMSFDELIEFLLTPTAQIAIVIGLTEVLKSLGISKKKVPLAALLIGTACGSFVYGYILHYGFSKGIVVGAALGLASSGLFSHTKIFKVPTPKNENRDLTDAEISRLNKLEKSAVAPTIHEKRFLPVPPTIYHRYRGVEKAFRKRVSYMLDDYDKAYFRKVNFSFRVEVEEEDCVEEKLNAFSNAIEQHMQNSKNLPKILDKVWQEVHQTLIEKNSEYGNSFLKQLIYTALLLYAPAYMTN